jgi:hypothetical protein
MDFMKEELRRINDPVREICQAQTPEHGRNTFFHELKPSSSSIFTLSNCNMRNNIHILLTRCWTWSSTCGETFILTSIQSPHFNLDPDLVPEFLAMDYFFNRCRRAEILMK